MKLKGLPARSIQRTTLRNTIDKFLKVKDKKRIIKIAREDTCHTQRNPHKAISVLLSRIFANQEGVEYIQSAQMTKKSKTRILYSRNKGEIKIFPYKQKLREFITGIYAL